MNALEIRTYRASDRDHCRALWAEMVQRHRDLYEDPSIGGEDPGLEFDLHLERVGPERIWLADADGEVVGLAALIVSGQEAEVEPVVVAARQRGAGVGRRLVAQAVLEARRLGVLCLNVKPVARNADAIAFFHRAGFRTLGHVQLFQWLGDDRAWKTGVELFGRSFAY